MSLIKQIVAPLPPQQEEFAKTFMALKHANAQLQFVKQQQRQLERDVEQGVEGASEQLDQVLVVLSRIYRAREACGRDVNRLFLASLNN